MSKLAKLALVAILMLVAFISLGAIYMQKDQHGRIIFSDTHFPNSQQIEIPDSSSTISTKVKTETPDKVLTEPTTKTENILPPSAPNVAAVNEDIPKVRENYTIFSIVRPRDQETIQNQVSIPVDIAIKPDLIAGDKIQLLIDNKAWGAPAASTHLQLTGVERGTHQLAAAIVDSNMNVVKKTSAITLYVHRASAATRPKPAAPPPTSLLPLRSPQTLLNVAPANS